MLMEEFEKWRVDTENKSIFQDQNDATNFSIFFYELTSFMTFKEILEELAWQIYELQVCMEGVLEDGQEDS